MLLCPEINITISITYNLKIQPGARFAPDIVQLLKIVSFQGRFNARDRGINLLKKEESLGFYGDDQVSRTVPLLTSKCFVSAGTEERRKSLAEVRNTCVLSER